MQRIQIALNLGNADIAVQAVIRLRSVLGWRNDPSRGNLRCRGILQMLPGLLGPRQLLLCLRELLLGPENENARHDSEHWFQLPKWHVQASTAN